MGLRLKKLFPVLFFISFPGFAQLGQTEIDRVKQIPNLPSPYLMRNWKETAVKYDEFIFSTGAAGQYLPLIRLQPFGVNYSSLQPILLDTYVGSATSGRQAEAINIIPALVGATLMGINKSNQNGVNWVIKAKDFFNRSNGRNVYLNAYSTPGGTDWWYDLMPNVFFYQLYSQYPTQPDFNEQFIAVADRWLEAVHAMGGSTTPWAVPQMNHRGWNLSTMTPYDEGVKEPESAGSLAWILYHAYSRSGNKKYLYGAQMAMEFLSGLTSNPSYELQLPYGTFVAAKMNAELGTHYNVEKMVTWCFDKGPLRNWGTIVGRWNGSDVSGLIGEANDAGNDYAFVMNGFQHAAALVPLVKYDKRFARAIAKWTLNLANASRLFYSPYLPSTSQDDFNWSSVNDPQSVIAHESLKENLGGKKLYATGDAVKGGWAQTNLSIYSSSSIGYLAALVEPTDVEGILLLDVNKTDFFGQNIFPSFLLYNPLAVDKLVSVPLGSAVYDIYDAISETVIVQGATGNTSVNVKADEVMMLVCLPQGSTPVETGGKLCIGKNVVDYHYGYHFESTLRIRSLAVRDTLVEFNESVPVYASVENATEAVACNWYVNGTLASSSVDFNWTVPPVSGAYTILLEVTSGLFAAKDSIYLTAVDKIPVAPVIAGFAEDKRWYPTGGEAVIICKASNADGGPLLYKWTLPAGSLISQDDSLVRWKLPVVEGVYPISCEVTNADGLKSSAQKEILVKVTDTDVTAPVAYFPLDGDTRDNSGNGHHATLKGAQFATDPRGQSAKAYQFTSGNDIIFIPNEAVLNFQDRITVSCWVSFDAVTQESFIISHGSWEERWKVSVTPDKKFRWTIKTSSGTKDLDGSFPAEVNRFYHLAVVYSGYSMELYVDGVLDAFSAYAGAMNTTGKAITFGRKDETVTNYALQGKLDEVRIYDQALKPDEITTLKSIWSAITSVHDLHEGQINIYPNPAKGTIYVESSSFLTNLELRNAAGTKVDLQSIQISETVHILDFDRFAKGLLILKVEEEGQVRYFKVVAE